jgi:hypothetical protein
MGIVARLDDIGRPAWIGLMVFGFVVFWPFGLMVLAFMIGSGRMGCWSHTGGERWQRRIDRLQSKMDKMKSAAAAWGGTTPGAPSSGNSAFDEYRMETLKRLEDEQREFQDFLERLRQAKDKAEFDQFMSGRRGTGEAPQADAA